jgi:2-desacetyl-2-hydroxyethyl bacteriochlorophyllide A dehydrogenase
MLILNRVMKALTILDRNELRLIDRSPPQIDEDEILIRSRAVGICHSDYELISGKYLIPFSYPIVPGHEWSGEVAEVGEKVSGFKIGDRVVGECVIPGADRIHHFGFSIDGADQEYFKVRPEWLHRLSDGLTFKAAALIEPFTCGFYALLRSGGTNASETVVISGGGNIGLCSAAAAVGMGAEVILIDPIAARRYAAKKIGAAHAIDPLERDPVEQVIDLTDGKGAHLVIEASGHETSLAKVLDYVREEGRISMVGISLGRTIPLEFGKVQKKNLTVRGCIGSPGVWPAAIRFLDRTRLDLSPIQTHEFPLSDGEKAFEFARDPAKCIKVTLLNQ